MRNQEYNRSENQSFEILLESTLQELPPDNDVINKITPWKKAANRLLIGFALNTVTFNFLSLNYILPTIGFFLLLLGFRSLRHENRALKACWIISVIRAVYFFPVLILNATIWQKTVSVSPFFTAFHCANIAITFLLILCLRSGVRSVQEKAGLTPHTGSITALLVWSAILCVLSLIQYSGWIIFIAVLIAYCFILRNLYGLSSELDEAGYSIVASPVKISDKDLVMAFSLLLVSGLAIGYLFFDKYPMQWTPVDASGQGETQSVKSHLRSLGFPDSILEDLTQEDLLACADAVRIVADQKDHPVNNGRTIVTTSGNVTTHKTVFDVRELRITSVAVELPGDRECWKIFHHFEWVVDTSFYGTEAIQLWSTDRDGFDWQIDGTFSGQVLYDDAGQTYAAPYYSLGTETFQQDSLFWGNTVSNDTFAAFSFPDGKERYRGYVSYSVFERRDGCVISSYINYVHQRSWMQYPVQTAMDYRMTSSLLSSDRVFCLIQDALQFHPSLENPEPF